MAVVLVVDDEARIRDLVRRYLEHDGHQVLTAGSGAEALAVAGHTAVDLIVLDLRLPDVSGEEVAAEIRSRSDVPISDVDGQGRRTRPDPRARGRRRRLRDEAVQPS